MFIINANGIILGVVAIMYAQHLEVKYYKEQNKKLKKKVKKALKEAK